MNLCFDLDGPIIDVSDRYYRAYVESLKDCVTGVGQVLSKEDFWKLKQNRVSDLEIGIVSSLSIKDSVASAELRKNLTFKEDYLTFDKLFEDVPATFDYLKSHNIIFFVVTLRRRKHLLYAVKQFKLNKYIDSERLFALGDEEKILNDIQGKHILLVNAINKLDLNPQETWLIGDSDTDVYVGRLAKCGKVIGIPRGIRSRFQLEIIKPDYIVNNLSEILKLVSHSFLPSSNTIF